MEHNSLYAIVYSTYSDDEKIMLNIDEKKELVYSYIVDTFGLGFRFRYKNWNAIYYARIIYNARDMNNTCARIYYFNLLILYSHALSISYNLV